MKQQTTLTGSQTPPASWRRILLLGAGLLVMLTAQAAPTPFIMGTDTEESTLTGKWYRLIYEEAFRRMGIPLLVVTSPSARLTLAADQDQVHGQFTRIFVYADAHPHQLRVEESLHAARPVLYAFAAAGATGDPRQLADLASGKWQVDYRRGVAICENLLKPLLPPGQLADVTSDEQGLKKLAAGRTNLYCGFDLAIQAALLTPGFKGISGYRLALDLGMSVPLYPYLHKNHAELAPKLAVTLRKMKAEGLIERYFEAVKRELEAPQQALP